MTGVGVALFTAPWAFLAIFKPETTTLAYASASIRASTTAYPLIALTVIIGAVFQGAGHTIYNLIVQLTRNMLMRIPDGHRARPPFRHKGNMVVPAPIGHPNHFHTLSRH